MSTSQRPRVIIITGPTSVGKSSTALQLCERLNAEIVSADSVQVYKYLDVGSNKASFAEQKAVPHHLVDVADPINEFSAGDFYRLARNAVADILKRGKVAVVVGGTMMYVRWLIHGRPAPPPTAEPARIRVEEEVSACHGDWEAGIALLAARDPKRVPMLLRNDWYRLTRALEVFETTGVALTDMPLVGAAPNAAQSNLEFDFRCLFLFGERRPMNRQIDRRCELMILPEQLAGALGDSSDSASVDGVTVVEHDITSKSILTEVSSLLVMAQLRVAPASPCLAIGYRQTISYLVRRALAHIDQLDGEEEGHAIDVFNAYVDDFQQATRTYAKQQIAWFRKDPMFHWVEAGSNAVDEIANVVQLCESDYEKLREETAEVQTDMKNGMKMQGKQMKTYISERTWLIKDSEAEKTAVHIGESCARQMATGIDRADLERMLHVVAR